MLDQMINNMKLRYQILLALILSLIILLFFAGIGVQKLFESEELSRSMFLSSKANTHFKKQVQEWKNILIRGSNKEDYKKHYASFIKEAKLTKEILIEVEALLLTDGFIFPEIEQFNVLHERINNKYHSVLDQYQEINNLNYKMIDDEVRGIDRKPTEILDRLIIQIDELLEEDLADSIFSIIEGIVLSVVIGGVFIFFITRMISKKLSTIVVATESMAQGNILARVPFTGENELGKVANSFNMMSESITNIIADVQKSGIQLSSSATTMAATAKEQEVSAKEQEATTNQIMVSSREIALTSKGLATNMDEVARVVDDTAELAEQGRNGLNRMGNTIGQMVDASHNISSKLAVLNEKASNITSVVTTINKVADQTNLLSVNAAIEADKAGEYGIGFGTVATEIRRLADQTAVATYDIEEMVKEMQSAVSAGVMGMEKFSDEVRRGVEDTQRVSEQLSQIVEQVQALAPHFESVHEGMHSQSQGAEQIQNALVQLSETIRGMNDSLRQSNTVVMNLNTESDRLQSAVAEFKLN